MNYILKDIQTWESTKQLLVNEFHPSRVADNAFQWILHPIQRNQESDPLITMIWLVISTIIVCYILQLITSNYSWVDRLWSVMPPIYAWYFAFSVPLPNSPKDSSLNLLEKLQFLASHHPRVLIMALLPTLWGIRLTFNFARKGGYTLKGEDYRWAWVHSWKIFHTIIGGFLWQLFAFGFICGFQHVLIFMFTTPAYAIYQDAVKNLNKVQALTVYDFIFTTLFVLLLLMETIADNQQWNYYERREKYRQLSQAEQKASHYEEEERGFNSSGLFAYCRHPNFFAERTIWFAYYFFVLLVTNVKFHWSILGTLMLNICIFPGSTWLTELISASKYPAYKIYQKYVPATIPTLLKPKINWNQKQE